MRYRAKALDVRALRAVAWTVAHVAACVACATFATAWPGGWTTRVAQARTVVFAPAASGATGLAGDIAQTQLPRAAAATLRLIAQGGPYPYAKDGSVFGNFERLLPSHPRGYYHEYTVAPPGQWGRNRGARRIVCGGPLRQTGNCFYSDDHYTSFRRIVE